MYKYKLVIFDLDGTLINSVLDLAIATNYALQHYGHPQHPEDKYRYFVGNGVDMLLYRSLPDECKNDEWVKKMRQVMMPYYAAHCTDNTAPYPGIVDMLKTIEREGIKIAIASNKHQSATAPMVAHYFGDIDFVAALGQREGFPTKPNPTIVDDILRIANVDRSRVLYVGDAALWLVLLGAFVLAPNSKPKNPISSSIPSTAFCTLFSRNNRDYCFTYT